MPTPERTLINHTIPLAETVPGVVVEKRPARTEKGGEELRKSKLEAWNRSKEGGRAWMALDMATEAKVGFGAFAVGTKETGREIDFIALRRAQAAGTPWSKESIADLMPGWRG